MTELTHDPEFPYVFQIAGDKPKAKFRTKPDADRFASDYAFGSVTDTTPPPPIPPAFDVLGTLKPLQRIKVTSSAGTVMWDESLTYIEPNPDISASNGEYRSIRLFRRNTRTIENYSVRYDDTVEVLS